MAIFGAVTVVSSLFRIEFHLSRSELFPYSLVTTGRRMFSVVSRLGLLHLRMLSALCV
jgi:hypothetical protein